MMLVALYPGGLLGELIGIERGLERIGTWLGDKTGSSGDSRFLDGFITASLNRPVMTPAALNDLSGSA